MLNKAITVAILQITLLFTGLSATVVASAAVLVADQAQVATGESLTVAIQKARTSVNVTWRSSKELTLEHTEAGKARFLAVRPGRALISATVDGELASTIVRVTAAPAAIAMPIGVAPVASAAATPLRPVLAAAPADMPAGLSWLRGVLPSNALMYARIPTLWGMLGAPKGNLYDQALRSTPYAAALQRIKSGLLDVVLPELPEQGRITWELLFGQLLSPLELAVMSPAAGAGLPEMVMTAALATQDIAVVNRLLSQLAAQVSGLALAQPLDADGAGVILIDNKPMAIYFHAAQQRLYLRLANPTGKSASLAQWVAALQPNPGHPMRHAEQAIDASGQGLFLWFDPGPLMAMVEQMGEGQNVAIARAFGGSEIEAVAMGMGTSNGKQRIKAFIDMPQVGFRSFLPAIDAPLAFATAGEPDAVLMLGLPDTRDLQLLEGGLAGLMPPEEMAQYQAAKTQFQALLGFSIEQLLDAFGDELLAIFDQAGQYLAVRVRDPAAYQRIVKQLVDRFGLEHERQQIQGAEYHHLMIPPLVQNDLDELAESAGDFAPLVLRLNNLPSHWYWIEEGEYLVLASLPQTLMDYRYMADKMPLSQWLNDSQGIDGHGALLLASARNPKVPRLIYEWNLLTLSVLGDLVGRPVDIFALPSPRELNLPADGSYSFVFSSSPQTLAMELVFESNPAELLLAFGGVQGIVMAGVLSAIAIPSYMEYADQAQDAAEAAALSPSSNPPMAPQAPPSSGANSVAEVLLPAMREVWQLQQQVVTFHRSEGRFPDAQELLPMMDPVNDRSIKNLQMEPNTGRILVLFENADLGGERRLLLTPQMQAGNAHWICDTTLESHLIPVEVCEP
jgi:hypothetical protein